MYGVLGDEDKRRASWLLSLRCAARVDPSYCACRKVYDETGDEVRPKPTPSQLCLLTRLRGQGDLSGEQFDKLYRFYREVFAKVCLCNWAQAPNQSGSAPCPHACSGHGG